MRAFLRPLKNVTWLHFFGLFFSMGLRPRQVTVKVGMVVVMSPPSYRIYINPYALVYDLLPLVHFLYQYLIHEHVIWTQYSQQHPNILILDSCDRSGKLWWGTLMYTNKHSSRCKRVFEFWEKCNLYKPRWRYTMLKVKITHLPINRWMINPAFTQSNSSAPNHSSLVAITTWGDWLAVNVVIFVANQFALARR